MPLAPAAHLPAPRSPRPFSRSSRAATSGRERVQRGRMGLAGGARWRRGFADLARNMKSKTSSRRWL
eukprot:5358100-Pyramimonas_sp.AAC.1